MNDLLADQILWLLVLMVVALLGLALFFASFTIVLRIRHERDARLWARLKATWEPLLLEAVLEPSKLPALWDTVGDDEHLTFLEFVLGYAQRLDGAEQEALAQAAEPYLPEILPWLNHRRMAHRARAVQTLGTLGLPRYTEEIKIAMRDRSPFVAAMAARALAHEVGPAIARDLCRSLDRFHNFRTWYLVDLLVAMGADAIPAIRETMEDQALSNRTRAVAAHALSVLRDLASADTAARLVEKEENAELLTSLLRLLTQVGTSAHATAARAHLDSPEFYVRAGATRTLSELGSEDDLPLLVEKLSDSSPWVRMAAARGVYRLGGRETLNALSRTMDPASPLFNQILAEEG